MPDPSTKNTTPLSTNALQSYPVVLLAIVLMLTNRDPGGLLTTAFTLILISGIFISVGILPLYIVDRTTPVLVASVIIIALGSGIGGLGIATILKALLSDTEIFLTINWTFGVALVLANLAVFTCGALILKISPITRPLLAATILFAVAMGYTVGYGILAAVELIVHGVLQIDDGWQWGIASVLNGAVIIVWTLMITRKTLQGKAKFAVPVVIIAGLGFVVLGVWEIVKSIFSL